MWRAAVLALAIACENESRLDNLHEPWPPRDLLAWERIAAEARIIDPASAHLDAAGSCANDEARRIAELEAWAEGGGHFTIEPVELGADHLTCSLGTALRMAKDHAGDDRALEAALYTAQRLRRDPSNLMFAMSAAGITRLAAEHRPHPPAFAARYAPSDDEVFHMLAGEAMWMQTSSQGDRDAAEKQWRWLADAPRDRIGLMATIWVRVLAHADDMAPMLPMYLDKMYASVDDYQRWLAR